MDSTDMLIRLAQLGLVVTRNARFEEVAADSLDKQPKELSAVRPRRPGLKRNTPAKDLVALIGQAARGGRDPAFSWTFGARPDSRSQLS
jgi:hypothetical protein